MVFSKKVVAVLTLAKRYRFSAAHTLRSPAFSDEENRHVFGKCANATGHGHDYLLEFCLSANVLTDDVVFGHGRLNDLVDRHIRPYFDRSDLNTTFGPQFISSGENLAAAAHRLLAAHLPASVSLVVRLQETEKNSFRFDGPDSSSAS